MSLSKNSLFSIFMPVEFLSDRLFTQKPREGSGKNFEVGIIKIGALALAASWSSCSLCNSGQADPAFPDSGRRHCL